MNRWQLLLGFGITGLIGVGIIGCSGPRAQTHDPDSATLDGGAPSPMLERVAGGMREPIALAFLSKDILLIGERDSGAIRWIERGQVRQAPFATFAGSKLLDVAIDPRYPTHPFVDALYALPGKQEIIRYTVKDGLGTARQALVDNLPVANGNGRLCIGADEKLYVTVGDSTSAQQDAA
jgi:glucose/arabinose dehydrogenase